MNQDKYISADNDPLQTSVFIAAQSQINSEFQRHRDEWITNQEAIGDELKELTLIMAHVQLAVYVQLKACHSKRKSGHLF